MPVEAVSNNPRPLEIDAAHETSPTPALPPPLANAAVTLDALSQLLLSIHGQNQESLKINRSEIASAQAQLKELQEQLAEQLKKALEGAKQAEKKEGGWFSKTFGKIVDEVAKIVGKAIEVIRDVVVIPAKMTVSFFKNVDNREALMQALRDDLQEFSEASGTEKAVTGFVAGTTKFAGDLMAFEAVLLAALAEGAVDGDSLSEAVKQQARQVWDSLKTNILENPEFWQVADKLVKVVAIAAAAMTGGAAAPIAVALLLLLEADSHYGFIEDAVGEKAAPWVRLGITVVAAALTAGSSNTSSAMSWLQLAAATTQGVGHAYQGYRIAQEADREADQIEADANVQDTLHLIQDNQRLIEALIELYEEKNDHNTRTVDQSVRLTETYAETEHALVVPA